MTLATGCARASDTGKRRSETKPSYYIVLGSSLVIAGLIQVEIIAIISPTEVEDSGLFMSSHCVQRSMRAALSIAESLGQEITLCYRPSPISSPPALPSLFYPTLFPPSPILATSPSLHRLTSLSPSALTPSLLWMISVELLNLASVSWTGASTRKVALQAFIAASVPIVLKCYVQSPHVGFNVQMCTCINRWAA